MGEESVIKNEESKETGEIVRSIGTLFVPVLEPQYFLVITSVGRGG